MSYKSIVEGLHQRFGSLQVSIPVILDYEPTSIQETPTLYTLLDTVQREYDGGRTVRITYRILHRLVFRWQDNEQAEQELIPFVNSLPAAVDADPKLGGRLLAGDAAIVECQAVFVSIGGTMYRCLDFYSEVVEISPLGSA